MSPSDSYYMSNFYFLKTCTSEIHTNQGLGAHDIYQLIVNVHYFLNPPVSNRVMVSMHIVL